MTIKLKADKRKVTGRKVKKLREEGIIPANVYGSGVKSVSVQVDLKEFEKVYKEAGETGLVELALDGKNRPVLIHGIHEHPVTDSLLHIDFLQVDLKKKVKSQVPVEYVGESPAEKSGLGTMVTHINEIEVEALPTDLPEKFEVDVSSLETLENIITVADIKADSKVTILDDPEKLVAKVEELREEEVIEESTPETEEGEAAESEETSDAPAEEAEEKSEE